MKRGWKMLSSLDKYHLEEKNGAGFDQDRFPRMSNFKRKEMRNSRFKEMCF
jgi:hypothetical protein